jgi:membrane protease YdiL (CAAX protease family)
MLWVQVAFLILVILLTGWSGLSFHHVTFGGWDYIPLWSHLESVLEWAGGRLFGRDNWVRNPVLYMVLPGLVLLMLGVRLPELGLRNGYRSWIVGLPFAVVLAVLAVLGWVTGRIEAVRLMQLMVLDHFLQNGFMEAFLFRGALLSRLTPLFGEAWSVVLSSLLFGVWHLGADTAMLQGDYMAGLASSIVSQATLGLLFGLMAVRTRSLIAPTLAHITVNMLG